MKTNMITLNNDFTKAYVSATFMKKAHVYGSREYMMLKEFRAENPDIIVAVRKSASGNTGSLSYENMERYIKSRPDAEKLLKEFKRVREESVIQRSRHLYVKNWFVAMFPNYKEAELFQKKEESDAESKVIPMPTQAIV